MCELNEWEDIQLSDTVRVITGEHLGRVGTVEEIHRVIVSAESGPARVRYVVVFRDDKMLCREVDPSITEATFEAIYPNPPAFVRITSEEAAEMVTTTADTIGK